MLNKRCFRNVCALNGIDWLTCVRAQIVFTWPVVGRVDGCGYDCQSKMLFVTLVGDTEEFQAH